MNLSANRGSNHFDPECFSVVLRDGETVSGPEFVAEGFSRLVHATLNVEVAQSALMVPARCETHAVTEAESPYFKGKAFVCPFPDCGVYAGMSWTGLQISGRADGAWIRDIDAARCTHCHETSLWVNGVLAFPGSSFDGPPPNGDLPESVLAIYQEARQVGPISKKSAAGLLRLALQTLVDDLEPGPDDLNRKIGTLVKKGLSEQVQQAMDAVRVIGNESVHPGTIDLDEDEDVLPALFGLVNIVADEMISKPKGVSAVYGLIPANKLAGIQQRDQNP